MKIAICGKMCSGKTTVTKMLIRCHPSYKHMSFASGLYTICYDLFDMSRDPMYKDRKLLQDVGSALRAIRSTVWIDYLMNKIERDFISDVIIDDGRFKDEVYAMRNRGFIIIRLKVDEPTQLQRLMKSYPLDYLDHWSRRFNSSETDLDDLDDSYFDYVFDTSEGADEIVRLLNLNIAL